eukprot:6780073-Alexandrium_andersonii.AAC.1
MQLKLLPELPERHGDRLRSKGFSLHVQTLLLRLLRGLELFAHWILLLRGGTLGSGGWVRGV